MSTINEQMLKAIKEEMDLVISSEQEKVIVDYERTVYVCPIGNVRVTFDRNISSSTDFKHFGEKNIAKRPIMPCGHHILEVKYDELLPDYIYKSLEIEALQRTTFSKYYLCRKYNMK